MTNAPTYEQMTENWQRGRHKGVNIDFLMGLLPGVPVLLAEGTTTKSNRAAVIRVCAKRHGIRVVLRSFDGSTWIMRLADETPSAVGVTG